MTHAEYEPPESGYRSLRWLLVLTVLMAVVPLAMWSHSARRQRESAAAITKMGGEVWYDLDLDGSGASDWPTWLVDIGGVDYFASVKVLYLNAKTSFTDADMKYLAGLTALEELFINHTQVTDAGLEHLHSLTKLTRIAKAVKNNRFQS